MSATVDPTIALPPGVPVEAVPFLEEVGYLQPDALKAGDRAPDLPLYTSEGDPFHLSAAWDERPVVLIFGSHT